MNALTTRAVFVAAVSVLVCSILATDEVQKSQSAVEGIPAKIYKCGTIMSDGKICGGFAGTSQTPIETSENLVTEVADLPSPFERPKTRENIFRHGNWALIANPYSDLVVTTDGQLEVDLEVPDIGITTMSWSPKQEVELAYRLTVDGTEVFKSEYREWRVNSSPYLRWTEVSNDVIKDLEEGKTLTVSLINREEEVVHFDEYSLSGFSENLIATRKLLKDSPRPKRDS